MMDMGTLVLVLVLLVVVAVVFIAAIGGISAVLTTAITRALDWCDRRRA